MDKEKCFKVDLFVTKDHREKEKTFYLWERSEEDAKIKAKKLFPKAKEIFTIGVTV